MYSGSSYMSSRDNDNKKSLTKSEIEKNETTRHSYS